MITKQAMKVVFKIAFILFKLSAVAIMATQVSGKFIYGGF